MQILVDTSTWIDYFKSGVKSNDLDTLPDENLIATNDVILAELVPFLKIKRQNKVVRLLNDVMKLPLQIDRKEIIQFRVRCLKSGISGIGIPDLIIVQNSKHNNSVIYSLDKHFIMLQTDYRRQNILNSTTLRRAQLPSRSEFEITDEARYLNVKQK
ncbi:MAG: PIN domain-containing protein [Candidatus Anammoxibacter sp.]